MTESDEQRGFDSVQVGVTQEELERMSDTNLAVWQANNAPQEAREHLAKYEWQRRAAERQMAARFALDKQLAKTGRMWGLLVAAIGVGGALLGVIVGNALKQESPPKPAAQIQQQLISPSQPPPASLAAPSIAPAGSPTPAPAPVASHPAIKKAP